MSRLQQIDHGNADLEQKALLDGIQSKLGMVPNFLKAVANSPAALRAFLGLHGITGDGVLDPQTRERLALAVAQQSGCQYCVSAHTAIGRKAGLEAAEMIANRNGTSADGKAAAALAFARALVDNLGDLTELEFQAVRDAGHTDAEIVEIVTHVALNLFTNFIGKVGGIEIDFPEIALDLAA